MGVRRLAAVVATVAVCASACTHGGAGAANSHRETGAVGQPASTTTQSLVQAFATAGVATVADETSTTPQAPVTGPRIFTLTSWQVANIDVELRAHDGISGADLDAMLAMPPHYPTFSDILGGWIIAQHDPDSIEAGQLLGAQGWTQPEQVVFPTAVTTLFMADLLQHVAAEAATPAPTGTDAAFQGSTNSAVEMAGLTTGIINAPCSTVSNFVDNLLDQVFDLLKLDANKVSQFVGGAVGGGVVGAVAGGVAGFLAGFWNHVVDLAKQSVQSLIQAVEQPVLNAMSTVIGAVAVFTMIRSYLKPWTTTVNPEPTANSFPLAPSHNPGSFTVVIDRNAEIQDWPDALVDCANKAGVPLPTLAAEGSPVFWSVREQTPGLVTTGQPRGPLNHQLTQTLTYATGNETPRDQQHATVVTPTVTADVSVRRTEVEELRVFVTAFLTSKVPKLVAPVINPIIASYVELATEYLDKLTAVTGTARITVSHHVPKPPPPCTSAGGVVPAGHYESPIAATIHSAVNIPGAPGGFGPAATGHLQLNGDVDLSSNGRSVTGTIKLSGPSGSKAGVMGFIATDHADGVMIGHISGSAAHPQVTITIDANDEIAGHVHSRVQVALPLTRISCTSITSNVVDLINEMLKKFHISQYLTIAGTGTWTAPRTG